MNALFSIHWLLVAGIWCGINGILHDIFIIKAHKGPYDRELLRLLMDGHLLILSGIVLAICWYAVRSNIVYGAVIGFVIALSMIVYCFMIFPFLKSFITLILSIILAVACINIWMRLSSVQ